MFREAAAQNDAEAGEALRKAAELGHPFSMQMLIRQFEDGDIIKRDPAAARSWAERAVAAAADDARRAGRRTRRTWRDESAY